MENTSPAHIDLGKILNGLDSLSNCMDQLALRTQLRHCDLIVCVGHPDKVMFLEVQEALKKQEPPGHDLKLRHEEQR